MTKDKIPPEVAKAEYERLIDIINARNKAEPLTPEEIHTISAVLKPSLPEVKNGIVVYQHDEGRKPGSAIQRLKAWWQKRCKARKKLTREQRDNRMFYMACIILAAVIGFGAYYCTHIEVRYEPYVDLNTVDLPEEQSYYLCYSALYYPQGYEDFFISVKGTYVTAGEYHAVKISPPESLLKDDMEAENYILTFEFEPADDVPFEDGDTIVVSGTFHLYEENERHYVTLKYAAVYDYQI